MSPADIVLLVAGLFFVIRGMIRGFSGEVISLIGAIGGFACAMKFYRPFAKVLSDNFGASRAASAIIAMLAIFFLIFIACALLEMAVKHAISKTNLTFTDKIFGGVVGLLKIYVLTLLVLIGGRLLAPVAGDAWMKESRALAAASFTWPAVSPVLKTLGVLPDIEAMQREARDYISKQGAPGALGSIAASGDVWTDIASMDLIFK
jgi:membrane protein required for colicin V production